MISLLARFRANKAVKRGIQMLDERQPDWRDRVDASRLNIAHGFENAVVVSAGYGGCVLTQIDRSLRAPGEPFGTFHGGRTRYGLRPDEAREMGFLSTMNVSYVDLTKAWKRALARQ